MWRRTQKSFTLIELLVVVAILAVLAGIIVPTYNSARARALELECSGRLRSIYSMLILYCTDFNTMPPATSGFWNEYADEWIVKNPYSSRPTMVQMSYYISRAGIFNSENNQERNRNTYKCPCKIGVDEDVASHNNMNANYAPNLGMFLIYAQANLARYADAALLGDGGSNMGLRCRSMGFDGDRMLRFRHGGDIGFSADGVAGKNLGNGSANVLFNNGSVSGVKLDDAYEFCASRVRDAGAMDYLEGIEYDHPGCTRYVGRRR